MDVKEEVREHRERPIAVGVRKAMSEDRTIDGALGDPSQKVPHQVTASSVPGGTSLLVSATSIPRSMVSCSRRNGRGAGPAVTLPSRENRLPWHGQAI